MSTITYYFFNQETSLVFKMEKDCTVNMNPDMKPRLCKVKKPLNFIIVNKIKKQNVLCLV